MKNWDYAQILGRGKDLVKKLMVKLSTKSWYTPAFIIFILLILAIFCNLVSGGGGSEPAAAPGEISHTEVAATIYAEVDMRTQIAATIYAELPTPEPTCTPCPTATPDPFAEILALYPCLPQNTDRTIGKVVEVVDGDTIKVDINGQVYSLRYIGIDCPECKDPRKPVEVFSREASAKNSELVEGKEVYLIKDVSEVDKYNRLLRYVFVGDTFVNYELVKEGYAHASTYPPDVACSDFMATAQNSASSLLLGFWGPAFNTGTETGIIDQPAPEPADDRAGCDPSYPTVCIPPYPPDLDCGDISFRRFQVLPPDPHNFDGDNDGIGCESG